MLVDQRLDCLLQLNTRMCSLALVFLVPVLGRLRRCRLDNRRMFVAVSVELLVVELLHGFGVDRATRRAKVLTRLHALPAT